MTTEQVPMTEQQHTLGLMIQWLRGISEPQTPGDRELDDEDLMFARAVLTTLQQHERLTADLAAANDRIARLEEALRGIANINNGPDQASAEWRCLEASAIAAYALIPAAPVETG